MDLKHFKLKGDILFASFVFADFVEAISFMTEVSFHCENLNHHPNWTNVYNRLEISLCTHDKGNIVTEKDYKLAQAIEKIFEKKQKT